MSTPPTDPMTAKVLDLLGQEALGKLHRHGFVVVDQAAVQRFQEEHRRDKDRVRETAAAGMRAIGINGARVELVTRPDGSTHLIFTAPVFDDMEFGRMVGEELKRAYFSSPAPANARPSKEPAYETTDVQISTTPGAPKVPPSTT